MKILVLNDDHAVGELLTAWLPRHKVDLVYDGDEAFKQYCFNGPYDLVLSDYCHKGLTLDDLIARIRSIDSSQPIGAVTAAWGIEKEMKKCKVPTLLMPFEQKELIQFVESTGRERFS